MTSPTPSKGLHIALWIVQVLVAASFTFGGGYRAFAPIEDVAKLIPWVPDVPVWVTRLTGYSEVLGALGLILPSATRIKPILTPIAAGCLAFVMVLAAIFHFSRGEYGGIGINAMYMGLLGFIIWGRTKKAPIAPRA